MLSTFPSPWLAAVESFMEQWRFDECVRQFHRATTQEAFDAAGWELRSGPIPWDE
ncbi:hypothetical protein [Streptomyces sp. NPDC048442]|uniref:hypothetical protein n=1 Tax=Streptomyces sp. NPDC048442 TaxID=3154823 RepID=UPI00341BDE3D